MFGDYRADGKTSIYNSYLASPDLVLESNTQTFSFGCSGNYINSTVTVPPGTLTITCDLFTAQPGSFATCEVSDSSGKIFEARKDGIYQQQIYMQTHSITNKEIVLNESTTLRFKITNGAGDTRSLPSTYSKQGLGSGILTIHYQL